MSATPGQPETEAHACIHMQMDPERSGQVSTNRLADQRRRSTRTRTTTMMPRTTVTWLLVAMVCLAATAATAYDDMADVNTYWQKRTQETRFKRGGPLRDLVNAAARYHQELNGNTYAGGRYLLEEKADAPAPSTDAGAGGAAAPPPDPVIHNTLADHEMIGA